MQYPHIFVQHSFRLTNEIKLNGLFQTLHEFLNAVFQPWDMHKLDIDQKIIQAGMFNRSSSEEDRRERLKSIMGGSSRSSWDGGPTAPEQLNRMLARSTEEFHHFQQVDIGLLHTDDKKKPSMDNVSVLVESGRLISKREVPDWITSIKLEGAPDEEPAELTRDMRRASQGAGGSGMINLDNLTDYQWLKLMEAQEAGVEYNLPHPKKRRRSDGPTPGLE